MAQGVELRDCHDGSLSEVRERPFSHLTLDFIVFQGQPVI